MRAIATQLTVLGGDAKHMARDVEEVLKTILAKAKDGSKETGEAECASSVGNARS